jgi:hypothetical protein
MAMIFPVVPNLFAIGPAIVAQLDKVVGPNEMHPNTVQSHLTIGALEF